MLINRSLWKIPIREDSAPSWPCPRCATGILQLLKEDFKCEELAASRLMDRNAEAWEPTFIKYVFAAIFKCNNKRCKERVTSCGQGGQVEDYGYDKDGSVISEYHVEFTPQYFYPTLQIFRIPIECPEPVREEIRRSFGLFFCDPPAAANHIRTCIESILTALDSLIFESDY